MGIAAGFSQTIYGLRRAVSAIQKLGQYTLEQKLGEGGMGVVYRASHGMLRRPTAIKLLQPDRTGTAALARFEREVRRTAMLTHPNTVTIFDYGRSTDGVFYYAMELLEGASLDEVVEVDGPQPEARVIHLLDQAAASLAEAHAAGLIHRDVKPGNILVVDRGGIADLVKVVDFGLVKDLGSKRRRRVGRARAHRDQRDHRYAPVYGSGSHRRARHHRCACRSLRARRRGLLAAHWHARVQRHVGGRGLRSSSAFAARAAVRSASRAGGRRSRDPDPGLSGQAP